MKLPNSQALTIADPPPLRCCLLTGGSSRRMGTDKALLPHPDGGTWLSRTLQRLAALGEPITLCSGHPNHRRLAHRLQPSLGVPVVTTSEPESGQGPLHSLAHLMALHGGERLLLCPVDMPWLDERSLEVLRDSARLALERVHVADDGVRQQYLLGVYPASAVLRRSLQRWLAAGHRSMEGWLAQQAVSSVRLPAGALRNCNHPADWAAPTPG
ncbi:MULTISPECIES: molybdenum cofactor guanylyltransferase [Aphanothece]|uniref:molybdenum cofactor guanylyltransferase n=1 Tax=Aphanothece stagnina TaxID=1004305 RepID=UPI003985457B